MRIRVVLAVGLAAIALAVAVVLLHSPSTVASTNGVKATALLYTAKQATEVCQQGETLPAGLTAVRVEVDAVVGPRVSVEALAGGRTVAHGSHGSGWFGTAVTVPVTHLSHASSPVTLCVRLSRLSGWVELIGSYTPRSLAATVGGSPLPGRLTVSYLRNGRRSWWAQAGAVIHHMGLGRAAAGSWIVAPILLLMLAAIGVGSWLIAVELR